MKIKVLLFALVAAFALVFTAASCQKADQNGSYGCSVSGEASMELYALADQMHVAVKNAVGLVSVRSKTNDKSALNAAQQVVDSRVNNGISGNIILYFAPSTKLGEPDAEKVILKTWKF